MANSDFQSVDEYISTQPAEVQAMLQRVRRIIRKAVPEADESISYQIPTYKLRGERMIYFAGFKEHYSLYPLTDRLVEAFQGELDPYQHGKGTIRFPISQPVPSKLIDRVVKFRAREAAELAESKAAAKNKKNKKKR